MVSSRGYLGSRGKISLLLASILLAALLFSLETAGAQASGHIVTIEGTGSGISEIVDPDLCSETGECRVEIEGTFDASEGPMETGTVRFRFVDDWSGISAGSTRSCTVPMLGERTFIWETAEGEAIIMTQTSGFICPSETGDTGTWKRVLRVDRGTGVFSGATGTVFMSGKTVFSTGDTEWTFEGRVRLQEGPDNGCFRAYFVSGMIWIPPKGAPPPGGVDFVVWLCGDDISISGPSPRAGYSIFNPHK